VATAADTDELVVSATRRETSIQDVPYNISAVSGDELQARRLVDLNDFARQVPGLTLTDQGARGSSLLTVRGLNSSSIDAPEIFLTNSGGDTVATYVGEIPVYVDLKLVDIERVEVLIGPQGTLYGAGTLGGAIRYIPKRPQFDETTLELHGNLYEMSKSSDLGSGGDAVINIPLINDRLAFRGVVGYEQVPGYIDYTQVVGVDQAGEVDPEDPSVVRQFPDANNADNIFGRAGLLWQVTDNIDANLTYYYQKIDSGGRSADSRIALGLNEYEYGRRFLEPKKRENHITSLEINWDLGFAEFTSATGYTEYDEEEQRDQTDLLLNFEYGYEFFPFFAAYTSDGAEEESFTQEFRLVSKSEGPWNWIAGAFYRDFDNENISNEFTPGIPEFFFPPEDLPLPTGDLEYRSITDQELEEIAVYGEIGYNLTDAWQITVGARWFEYEDDTQTSTFLPFLEESQPPFPDTDPVKEDDVIFRFNTSLDYGNFLGSEGTVYLTVAEGYRNGRSNGITDCPQPGESPCATEDEQRVDADTTVNYEIGAKTQWFDGALTLNGSLFLIDWDDIRVSTITAQGDQPIDTNGSSAESKGIELSGVWQANENWSFSGSYAYTNAELTENAPGLIGGRFETVDGADGDRLPGTPENQLAFFINYTTVTDTGVTIDAEYGFTSISDVLTKVGGKNGGEALPGFTVHNASVGITQDNWTATLYADNLFNKYAATGVRRDRDYIGEVNGFTLRGYYQNIIQPRTIGLDLRVRFDL
jgi:outer membrane receptor protein involved in Fe transport